MTGDFKMIVPNDKLHKKLTKAIDEIKMPFVKLRNAAGISKDSNGVGTVKHSNGYWYKDVEFWIEQIEKECTNLKSIIKKNEKDLMG